MSHCPKIAGLVDHTYYFIFLHIKYFDINWTESTKLLPVIYSCVKYISGQVLGYLLLKSVLILILAQYKQSQGAIVISLLKLIEVLVSYNELPRNGVPRWNINYWYFYWEYLFSGLPQPREEPSLCGEAKLLLDNFSNFEMIKTWTQGDDCCHLKSSFICTLLNRNIHTIHNCDYIFHFI